MKTSARNACMFCATDKERRGLATAFLALSFVSVLSNPIMAIKAVQSELLCIPNSTGTASRMEKIRVCGGPGLRSCTNIAGIRNTYHVEGILMHKFPANEEQRKIWIEFVRKYRPNLTPTNSSVICSAYFETSCFESRPLSFTKNAVFVCFSYSLSAIASN